MKLIMLSTDDCSICQESELKFRETFKKEIDKGEAEVVNLDQDESMQQLWFENELPLAPTVILVTNDKKKVISNIDPEDLLEETKEASPAVSSGSKQPQVDGGSKI